MSGVVTVSAEASDNVGVAGVQFRLAGVDLGAEDTTAPYSISWNTTTTSNGSHTLTAVARDTSGNTTVSSSVTVAVNNGTPDTTPPVISGVGASSITSSGATINWTTDEPADSQLEYGTTPSFGSSTTLDTTLVTSHSQSLRGLTASTTYYFRVKSRDAAGNLATSGSSTFTTASAPGPGSETVSLIRQDCTGFSNCYTSLAAWGAAFGGINFAASGCALGNLVCANKIAVAQIDGPWSSSDTTAVTIDGWTTDATRYVRIYTTPAARH